ncbi:MAG TPA: Na/Pi cotransporter family protein [Rectinemataceae bacterium]
MPILTMALQLFGGLALFMFGMERTSEGIQRAAGERLQNALNFMTKNSLMAVLTGTLVTVAIQSSSATTVMLITFVNAGLLSLQQGIGVIMGANIGTTLTGWIIASIGIAKFSIAALAVPIFGVGFFMTLAKRRPDSFKSYGNALTGLSLIFLGLGFIAEAIPNPSPEMLESLRRFSDMGFLAVILAVLAGTVFTVLINASSATLAIVIAMASQGLISFELAAALTLGANIGTTFDAFLASISAGASTAAKRAAWAHILFNVLGTAWVLIAFKPFLALVDWVVPGELGPGSVGVHIAMLHTLFNAANTLILLPFVRQYAGLLASLVKEKPGEADARAIYMPRSLMPTPELSLLHARAEISGMASIARAMFDRVQADLVRLPEDFDAELAWFEAKESYVDGMNEELSKFLISITTLDLSERTRTRVGLKLRIVSELENMTDECLSIAYLLKKMRNKRLAFDADSLAALEPFSSLVDEALELVISRLHVGMTELELGKAAELEERIDAFKKQLKKSARRRLKDGADVKAELLYIDLIRHIEKMGDCAYSIAQELRGFGS